jgi:hypothetical protein
MGHRCFQLINVLNFDIWKIETDSLDEILVIALDYFFRNQSVVTDKEFFRIAKLASMKNASFLDQDLLNNQDDDYEVSAQELRVEELMTVEEVSNKRSYHEDKDSDANSNNKKVKSEQNTQVLKKMNFIDLTNSSDEDFDYKSAIKNLDDVASSNDSNRYIHVIEDFDY